MRRGERRGTGPRSQEARPPDTAGIAVDSLRPGAQAIGSAQWNWPSSVEPFKAAVEVFGSTVVAMVSK